ncbi:MAG: serine hydrolase domain-containing protein, partial [Saprospiraceae bacterium]
VDEQDFSGAILIAHKNEVIEKRAYGTSCIEFDTKNRTDTKFNIASITKMMTAVATLQLVDNKTIDLHTPIGAYLPDYPNQVVRDSVTVHQLLSHTSGLNNFYVEEEYTEANKLSLNTVEDFIPLFSEKPLLSSPGKQYNYSASGFVLLGRIIEKTTGQDYFSHMRDNILGPLNMMNTTELEVDSVVKNKASGYNTFLQEDHSPKKNEYYLSKASPAGFYYSTIEDLFKFSKALRNYKLLSKETTELMFEPKVKGYTTYLGYGMDIDLRYNQKIIGHSGGWYGVRGELIDFMKDGYTVVILSNVDDDGTSGTSKLSDSIKELIGGKLTSE